MPNYQEHIDTFQNTVHLFSCRLFCYFIINLTFKTNLTPQAFYQNTFFKHFGLLQHGQELNKLQSTQKGNFAI